MNKILDFPLKAALIGLGNIAWKYDIATNLTTSFAQSQAGAILQNPNLRLVGGFSPQTKDRQDFSKWSNCPTFSSLDKMLKETQPEFIGICSPPQYHFTHFMTALEFGVRVFWLEKPPTSTIQELQTMQNAAQKYGATVCVNYFRRTQPAYQQLKTVLQQKQLGECRLIQILYSPGLARNGCHLIDQLFFLTDSNNYQILWLDTQDRTNPNFGLQLSTGQKAAVCGCNLPYHTNDIQAIFDNGIFSIRQGGSKIELERSVPDPIAPGFFERKKDCDFSRKWNKKINQIGQMNGSLLDLIKAFKNNKQPMSSLQTAALTQQVLYEVLQGEKICI